MFKNRENKGFTLIELLAVIVVLAIIALISIPIITNVIEKAKKGSVKSSAYGLVEAGELYIANNLSAGISEDIEFTCSGSKCIKDDKEIAYKGDIDSGTLKIYTDGKITLCIEKDSYGAYKLATEKEVTVEKGTCNDNYKVDAYISKGKYDELNQKYNDLVDLLDKSDATAADIKVGKKAYVNGELVTGTYKGTEVVVLGTTAGTYNIKNLYPSSYQTFTVSNFTIQTAQGSYDSRSDLLAPGGNSTGHIYHGTAYIPSWSYNATTGILTVSNGSSNCYLYYNNGATLGAGGSNTNGTSSVIPVNKVMLVIN